MLGDQMGLSGARTGRAARTCALVRLVGSAGSASGEAAKPRLPARLKEIGELDHHHQNDGILDAEFMIKRCAVTESKNQPLLSTIPRWCSCWVHVVMSATPWLAASRT